jgi:hypothetical protein
MGRSAGRSLRNKTGQGAERRAPERERVGIDPPGHAERARWADEEDQRTWWDDLTPRGRKVMDVIAVGSYVFMCVLLAIVVCAWWGLI